MTRGNLSRIASKRLQKIHRLEKLLAAEQQINRALEKLAYSPNQSAVALGRVKRAYTMKKQLNQPEKPNQ